MRYLFILLSLAACQDKGRTKAEDVKREIKQAVDTTAQYAKENVSETRDDAVRATEAELQAIDRKMDELKSDIQKRNDQAKAQAQRSLAELEEKRVEIAQELEQMKKDTADSWKETRRKVNAVATAFDAAYKEAMRR